MTRAPRITIVTPSFNQGSFIEETINSVLSQNYPNLEYIVMDGGSTDETTAILNRYRERFAYCVSQHDDGQTDALIKGFGRATGDIWGWLCADDVLLPGALDAVALTCPENGWVIGSARVMDASGASDVTVAHDRYRRGDVLFNSYLLSQVSVFWSASLYRRVRGLDRQLYYCMDWDLWTQFEAICAPRIIDEVLAGFRVHPAAKTAANNRMWDEIWSVRRQRLHGQRASLMAHRARWKVLEGLGRLGVGPGAGHTYIRSHDETRDAAGD